MDNERSAPSRARLTTAVGVTGVARLIRCSTSNAIRSISLPVPDLSARISCRRLRSGSGSPKSR
ncbi:Uncharacterised protein [Mycobacterium tuberculosis]|uniref:Uncharacterized protein n=1 Tax=Mycobacterium tuberculosis TaxID=1773 RepID=A0A916P6R7_MYCTX|nr:Uncharacterised protein [Mycobacterium tuberculosis]